MKAHLYLMVCFFVSFGCTQSQKKNEFSQSKLDGINSYLEKIEGQGFSGSILVRYKGERLISKGFGFSDRDKKISNSTNTIFDVGSVTKQFTATAIMQLEEKGLISTKDSLGIFFESAPEDIKPITIHQLLTHSSGFVDAIGFDYDKISEESFLKKAFVSQLLFQPGLRYEYSNLGYSLLALIIEKVSGLKYEQYLIKNLFEPSGMFQTGYLQPNFESENTAVGYNGNRVWGRSTEKFGDDVSLNLLGNGGVLYSIEDVLLWHKALQNGSVLSAKSLEKLYKPYIREGEDVQSWYAYGWAVYPTPRNTYLLAHNGSNNIFFADVWRYLTEDLIIVVMSNNYEEVYELITTNLAGFIFRDDYKPIFEFTAYDEDSNVVSNDNGQETPMVLINAFENAISSDKKQDWEEFLKEFATPDFLTAVPMEQHLKMFQKFSAKFEKRRIEEVVNKSGDFDLILDNGQIITVYIEQFDDENFGLAGVVFSD